MDLVRPFAWSPTIMSRTLRSLLRPAFVWDCQSGGETRTGDHLGDGRRLDAQVRIPRSWGSFRDLPSPTNSSCNDDSGPKRDPERDDCQFLVDPGHSIGQWRLQLTSRPATIASANFCGGFGSAMSSSSLRPLLIFVLGFSTILSALPLTAQSHDATALQANVNIKNSTGPLDRCLDLGAGPDHPWTLPSSPVTPCVNSISSTQDRIRT
jgi:hypothetical protein